MKIKVIEKILGSGFYTGYIPFAPGTFGSLAAIIIYLIPGFEKPEIIIPLTIIFFVLGIKIGDKFEEVYGKDPSQCTIDEIVGTWISLFLIPKTAVYIIITFVIWRIFDIIKPYPANKLEKLKGGLGIMMDDVVSGVYAALFVHLFIFLFSI